MASAIAAEGLGKVYGAKVALADLTLEVEEGEVFGFLGPNGAGKTTAVKLLLGLALPTSGSARLLGRPLGDLAVKGQIGFLPEHFRFHEWLRAEEFLDFHATLLGLAKGERRRRVPEVLALVGLADCARQRLRTFSKGMLQRVGIAQALVGQPRLVFLDEPTSALDPVGRRDVRNLIRDLKGRGVTVFLNSHLLSEVEMVCDRVAIVNRGRVVQMGRLSEMLAGGPELELEVEGVSEAMVAELRSLSASLSLDGRRMTLRLEEDGAVPRVAETVVRHGGQLYGMVRRRSNLEELFLKVVEESE